MLYFVKREYAARGVLLLIDASPSPGLGSAVSPCRWRVMFLGIGAEMGRALG